MPLSIEPNTILAIIDFNDVELEPRIIMCSVCRAIFCSAVSFVLGPDELKLKQQIFDSLSRCENCTLRVRVGHFVFRTFCRQHNDEKQKHANCFLLRWNV
jgi:hypothetical protein